MLPGAHWKPPKELCLKRSMRLQEVRLESDEPLIWSALAWLAWQRFGLRSAAVSPTRDRLVQGKGKEQAKAAPGLAALWPTFRLGLPGAKLVTLEARPVSSGQGLGG